ncbi:MULTISPECIES: CheR family methyltransferase [Comamonas]|uniref:Protein-glutamate O-methyltransferase CheR n=1 Tax=Comamonas squillarum TaxID=2977320 RepID=A0ABY6A0W6_9BURK|nr:MULTISPECIES: CheR family methyltransferase [Comamonas]PWB21219.1 chemotaxis protein CheR [Comamonas sp. JNW]UXC19913.1 protein-glutamate O-methyltransferase CheR [Comamonas sp. PR12]
MPLRKKAEIAEIEQRLLLDGIYYRYHYDFRGYAQGSIKRGLEAALAAFGCKTLSQLQDRIMHDPSAFTALLGYLTVQVSDMFRDPAYFAALRREVVPLLRTYPSLKIWVAGCSTGEEVYSLAILLHEEGLLERSLIYATDINSQALRVAEQGIFGIERAESFSANYLKSGGKRSLADYYTAHYGHIVLDKELRKNVVFADHSLATDSVFAEMHLISCRNVLIYFDTDLQNRALDLFRQSLCHRGFLGLGMKESLRFSNQAPAFEDVAVVEKIYQKKPSID